MGLRLCDLLDPLFARQPNHAEVNFHRACALQQLGRLDAAVAGFDRVVALQPNHAEAHLRRGRVLAALKLHEAAVVAFDRAIGCRPDSASAYANRALALMQLGMPEAALASGDRAVALDARSARYRNLRGAIRNRLRQHEAEIADYQQAIALQPGFAEPWMRLGWRMDEVLPSAEVLRRLQAEFALVPLAHSAPGETAERWGHAGADGRHDPALGEIGLISSVTRPFCGDCNRARLSTEGRLYLCLFASQGYDLRALLRGGASDEAIGHAICAIWGHRADRYSELRASGRLDPHSGERRIEMSYIGG